MKKIRKELLMEYHPAQLARALEDMIDEQTNAINAAKQALAFYKSDLIEYDRAGDKK